MVHRVLCVLVLAVLAGCAAPAARPSAEQIEQADIGPRPDDRVLEVTIKAWLDSRLKDPESARYTFLPVEKGCYRKRGMFGSGGEYQVAWVKAMDVNAKNSYGGYTGRKMYVFYFVDGKLASMSDPDSRGDAPN